jgi:hypothetical protein
MSGHVGQPETRANSMTKAALIEEFTRVQDS